MRWLLALPVAGAVDGQSFKASDEEADRRDTSTYEISRFFRIFRCSNMNIFKG